MPIASNIVEEKIGSIRRWLVEAQFRVSDAVWDMAEIDLLEVEDRRELQEALETIRRTMRKIGA